MAQEIGLHTHPGFAEHTPGVVEKEQVVFGVSLPS
jgi:hypothetical protein